MATTITTWFIAQYNRDVHHLFQRKGSQLRGAVRMSGDVPPGSTVDFKVMAKGEATTKGRHGAIPPMNAAHTSVTCTLADYFAGDWVDRFDQLKTNSDEYRVETEAGAYALGRKIDRLIIDQLDATTNASASASGSLTRARVLEAFQTLGQNDAFEAGKMYAAVDYEGWADLMTVTEFASADYVSSAELPWLRGGRAKMWMDTYWFTHSGLTDVKSSTTHKAFWWNMDAVGAAFGQDVQTDAMYYAHMKSTWVDNSMSMGAKLIDASGVFEIQFTGS